MLASKDPYIESAYQQLQIISQNQEKRLEYEAREKAVRDHLQYMREAEERGLEQGRIEGRMEGRMEGRIEGRIEGIQAIILDNLEEGISKDRILIKLQKRFDLTEKQAAQYYQQFSHKGI
ncbi:hypothetical protein D3Z58_20485 [Clostridiaceae bacterium]|nr:hypothetical protein [Clostridiaceae bacterium]